MDKVLVIGASGLLGSKLMEIGKGKYEMLGTYNTRAKKSSNHFKLDVTDRKEVFKLIEELHPKLIVDTHAMHNVDYCETHLEESWLVNVEGTKNVAEAAKKVGAKYVFISTDYVFDGKKMVYSEKDKPVPLNYYAKCKRAGETILDALGVDHVIVRAAGLYGLKGKEEAADPSEKPVFLLWLLDGLRKGEKIKILSDQHLNYTLVDNLAEIIFRLFELDESGIFHASGKDSISKYIFAKAIAHKFGHDASLIEPITTPELNQVARRPERANLDTNKVERVTGMKTLSLDEGLDIIKAQMGV